MNQPLILTGSTPNTALTAEDGPTRLIGRIVAEVQLAVMTAALDLVETENDRSIDLDRAVVLFVILRAGYARQPGLKAGDDAATISINAMASSLNRPFETVRRHVNALIAAGICCKCRRGVCISSDFAGSAVLERTIGRVHDAMVLLIVYVRRHGIALPPQRPDIAYDKDATIAAALDLLLAAFEYVTPYYSDWMEMRVLNAIIAANARRVTFDPGLAQMYARRDTIPPDRLRVPVSVAEVARVMRIPYSTTQRYVNRAIAEGRLRRVTGGVLATQELLAQPAVQVAGPAAMAKAMRAFGRLVPGGFPFDDPASCYLVGPPDLLDFGTGMPAMI